MTIPAVQDTAQLRADSARITELIGTDLDAAVPACPGWDVRDLAVHLGGVHRWARECIETGAPPQRERSTDPLPDPPPEEADGLARWFGDGAIALANTIDAADPDAATWMPFPVEHRTVSVWTRRQTHETSLHRWDAESAVAAPRPIDPALASDGIDEYFSLVLPRLVDRDGLELPSSSLHVHCTDTEGEWTVEVLDGALAVDRAHRKGDAALRGSAEHLLLRLWGRPVPDGAVDVVGDEAAAGAWLSLGGT